jgi:hypothetical protein
MPIAGGSSAVLHNEIHDLGRECAPHALIMSRYVKAGQECLYKGLLHGMQQASGFCAGSNPVLGTAPGYDFFLSIEKKIH